MNKNLLTGIIAVLEIGLSIGGCSWFEQEPKQPVKIKIGTMAVGDCLPLFVAQEKGFFTVEGLEVVATPMAGGAVIAPAVESGELDIGFSNTPSIIIAHEEGFDFRFLTPGNFIEEDNGNIVFLIVSKTSALLKPGDIEGKTVAINTKGGIIELTLKAWAEKNGVDFSKINIAEVPFPQMESALESKQADAALTSEPYGTISVLDGVAKILDSNPLDAIAPKLMIASWFATDSWIKQHSQEVKAFANAITKANQYISDHPGEMPGVLIKYTSLRPEVAAQVILPVFKNELVKSDLQVMIDASQRYGFISQVFDARDIVADDLKFK